MRAHSPWRSRSRRAFPLFAASLLGVAFPVANAAERVVQPLGARVGVCFPPGVPVFGDEIREDPRAQNRGNFVWVPPVELADYVNEAFYPALSTRMMMRSVSARMETKLEAYRARRAGLVNELADRLVALHGEDDATRERELQGFAAQQSPKIVTLEAEAEELRRELIGGHLFQSRVDWSNDRPWTLGVTRFPQPHLEKEAEFQVVRAAAFYSDGLGAEQRGLLLELAEELRAQARAARPIPIPRGSDLTAMFFSPATTRFRLPKNATPRLVALLGRFNGEKAGLKQELHEAVLAHDKSGRAERREAFDALSQRQWPRLVELEKLADQIRAEVNALPPVRLRAAPQIPDGLMQRIVSYREDRAQLLAEFDQALRAPNDNSMTSLLEPGLTREQRMQRLRKSMEARVSLRVKAAQEFQEATRERSEELRRRYDAIQADLKVVASAQLDPETGKPYTADTLLEGYSLAVERFDAFGREEVIYRGYRIAMLTPGLSPEQRRLLFGAALVGLAQPLPFGEPMPAEMFPVPRS